MTKHMAKVSDLLAAGPTYSFEFFPPKDAVEAALLMETLRELEPLRPSFVSVTFRAVAAARQRTVDIVMALRRRGALNPMAHLICAGQSCVDLTDMITTLGQAGVRNFMALAGDPPLDPSVPRGELSYATELVALLRALGDFCVGVAAHPDGHPRSPTMSSDRDFLARKLELADFAITQFFFEAKDYFRLVDDVSARGVSKPVLPGIMPVTSLSSIPRMSKMGTPVPAWLVERLEACATSGEDIHKVGVQAATELCSQLLGNGAPGLHFYTLNRSSATRQIHANLGLSPAGVR